MRRYQLVATLLVARYDKAIESQQPLRVALIGSGGLNHLRLRHPIMSHT